MLLFEQRFDDFFAFSIKRTLTHRLAGATVPVSGVILIAFLAMEIGVNPRSVGALVLLGGLVRPRPIVLGIPP